MFFEDFVGAFAVKEGPVTKLFVADEFGYLLIWRKS
jgi:hypothetical protein